MMHFLHHPTQVPSSTHITQETSIEVGTAIEVRLKAAQ